MCIQQNLQPVELDDEENNLGAVDFGMYGNNELIQGNQPRNNRMNPELLAGRQTRQRFIRNHFAL